MSFKEVVLQTVSGASTAVTSDEIYSKLQIRNLLQGRRMSSVGRALRHLAEEGRVYREVIDQTQDLRYGRKKWSLTKMPTPANQTPTASPVATQPAAPIPPKIRVFSTLRELIKDQIASFAKQRKEFTAHEVTSAVRQTLNEGSTLITDPEQGLRWENNHWVPDVQHAEVRQILAEVFVTNVMDRYLRKISPSGSHHIYYTY